MKAQQIIIVLFSFLTVQIFAKQSISEQLIECVQSFSYLAKSLNQWPPNSWPIWLDGHKIVVDTERISDLTVEPIVVLHTIDVLKQSGYTCTFHALWNITWFMTILESRSEIDAISVIRSICM